MDVVKLSTNVAAQAANSALLAHGVPGGAALTQALLGDLLQVQDQQAEAIGRIEGGVERLLNAPWNTARMYLNEATQAGQTPADVRERLSAAAGKLREAVAQQEEKSFARAHACLDLTLVLRMLGEDSTAALYAQQVVPAASEFLRDWTVAYNQKWLGRIAEGGTGEGWASMRLLSAQSVGSDPVLVWATRPLRSGSAESPRLVHTDDAVRERLCRLLPASASADEASSATEVETDTQTGTEPEPRPPLKYMALALLAGTVIGKEAAQGGVGRAMHIAAWRRQRLLKRELGLQILFKSEHPVASGSSRLFGEPLTD
jgi:hypothetical protein